MRVGPWPEPISPGNPLEPRFRDNASVPAPGGAGPSGWPSDLSRFQRCFTRPRLVKRLRDLSHHPAMGTAANEIDGQNASPRQVDRPRIISHEVAFDHFSTGELLNI